MSYFLPYDNYLNVWFNLTPTYEWVAVPPAEDTTPQTTDANAPAGTGGDASASGCDDTPPGSPPMQWVFKSLELTAVSAWNQRADPYHQMMRDGQKDDDDTRALARKSAASRLPAPKEPGAQAAGAAEPTEGTD